MAAPAAIVAASRPNSSLYTGNGSTSPAASQASKSKCIRGPTIPASGAIVWPMADGGFVAPLWSRLRGSGLDTGETCCFIQKRIAFFGGLVALLSAGFFIIGFGIDV